MILTIFHIHNNFTLKVTHSFIFIHSCFVCLYTSVYVCVGEIPEENNFFQNCSKLMAEKDVNCSITQLSGNGACIIHAMHEKK